MTRQINQKGLDLIKHFEGCKLTAYKDIVGVLTIGYGHTGADVFPNQKITQYAADMLLLLDIVRFEKGIEALVNKPLTDNQFAAIVCLSYNIGLGNFSQSSLLKWINKGMYDKASEEFIKWNKAGGKPVHGLTVRREAEKKLFMEDS